MACCIDAIGEAKVFSTLSMYSRYWKMNIRKEKRPKTAFVTNSGTFHCICVPFGFTKAHAASQRALNVALTKYKLKICLVYLHDIIIYSNSIDEHIDHVDNMLHSFKAASLTLRIKKCKFFTNGGKYLGCIIKPEKLEIGHTYSASLK